MGNEQHTSLSVLGFLLVVVGLSSVTYGGNPKGVDPEFLALTDCPHEPGCPGLILLDERELNNEGNRSKLTARRVVKIFTDEAIERHGQVQIPATIGGWDVRNLSGSTYLPDGREIKLQRKDTQVKNMKRGSRRIQLKSATFPGVIPGAIIEFSYDIVTKPYSYIVDHLWDIQQDLPILESRFVLKDGGFKLGWTQAGSKDIEVVHTKPYKHINTFVVQNVPPIPQEPFGPPVDTLQARLYFGLSELQGRWVGAFAGQIAGEVAEFMASDGSVKEKADELIEPGDSKTKRTQKIYEFVQSEIGSETERATAGNAAEIESVDDVLKAGYGSADERTMLFLALAEAAGLESGMMLVVSRENGLFDPDAYDEEQFDTLAAAVKIERGWTFYDPAIKGCPFGMVSSRKEGAEPNAILFQVHKGAGALKKTVVQDLHMQEHTPIPYSIVNIPFSSASKNRIKRKSTIVLAGDGSARGSVSTEETGHADMATRRRYRELDDEERLEELKKRTADSAPGVEVVGADFNNLDTFGAWAKVEYDFVAESFATVVGERLLVTPSFLNAELENPFTASARRTDVWFPYRYRVQEATSIEIPDGYEVDTLPEATNVRDTPFVLTMSYLEMGGKIVMKRRVDIDAAVWAADDYDRLKDFYGKLREADKQVIVLKKTEQVAEGE